MIKVNNIHELDNYIRIYVNEALKPILDCCRGNAFKLNIANSNAIYLTGNGSCDNRLLATLKLSTDTGNIAEIHGDGLYVPTSGGSGADILVKVSVNDTTSGYLNGKLVADEGILFAETNDGGNETLSISLDSSYTDGFYWGKLGDVGTDSTINFIGTTDLQSLIFKTNNTQNGVLSPFGNIGFGIRALANAVDAGSIAIGSDALPIATATAIAIGNNSLGSLGGGIFNIAIGSESQYSNTIGQFNVSLGNHTLATNISSSFNVAIGHDVLTNTIAGLNTAVGYNAMRDNTTGTQNVAMGMNALLRNTTGFKNTAGGAGSLENNTVGQENTAYGQDSGLNNVDGIYNLYLGVNAKGGASGVGNVILGYYAGASLVGATQDNIFLGRNAGFHVSQKPIPVNTIAIGYNAYTVADNEIVLGNLSHTKTGFWGEIFLNTAPNNDNTETNLLTWNSGAKNVEYRTVASILAAVSTPTWQQTLTSGSTLTGSNTIAGGGFSFTWNALSQLALSGGSAGIPVAYFTNTTSANALTVAGTSTSSGLDVFQVLGGAIATTTLFTVRANGTLFAPLVANTATQDRLLGQLNATGQIGNVIIGTGLSLSGGTLTNTGVTSISTWQQVLTAGSTLTGNNTITGGTNIFTWDSTKVTGVTTSSGIVENFNSLTTGTGHYIGTTSGSINGMKLLHLSSTGFNAGTGISYGAYISNQTGGISATNVAGYFEAFGTGINFAAQFARGKVSFGTLGTESGMMEINGSTSGTITLRPQAIAGSYEWDWPTTAGTAGYFLTSGGGVGVPMTWTDPSTLSGGVTDFIFTDGNGFNGTVTTSTSTPTLSLTTQLTTASVPFIGASGALVEDNSRLIYDVNNQYLMQLTDGSQGQAQPRGIIQQNNGNYINPAYVGGRKGRGSFASPTALQSGDGIFGFGAAGYDGSTYGDHHGLFQFNAAENFSGTNKGTYAAMYLTPIGSSVIAQKYTFTADPYFGINNTNPASPIDAINGMSTSDVQIQGFTLGTSHTSYPTKARWGVNFNTSFITQNAKYNGTSWSNDDVSFGSSGILMENFSGVDTIFFNVSPAGGSATEGGINRMSIGTSALIINDIGGNYDVRIEGDTDANLIFVDASADMIGFGTNSPSEKVDILGKLKINATIAGTAQSKTISANDTTTTDYANLAFFNASQATARAAFLISNNSSGDWVNNYAFFGVNGASFASNFYFTNIGGKTSDAGYTIFTTGGGQGTGMLIGPTANVPLYLGVNNSAIISITSANVISGLDISVPDEVYDATNWNGSLEVPTKNAIRDKIESMSAGGITRSIILTSGSATMGSTALTDYVYFVTGAHTMSLPAAGNTNKYTVKNNHVAAITVDTAGAENVEGVASVSIPAGVSYSFQSDNTNWWII